MVTLAQRREAIAHLETTHEMSERRRFGYRRLYIFVLARRVENSAFRKIDTISPRNHVHHFRLTRPEDITPAIRAYAKEAYGVGCQEPFPHFGATSRFSPIPVIPRNLNGAAAGPRQLGLEVCSSAAIFDIVA